MEALENLKKCCEFYECMQSEIDKLSLKWHKIWFGLLLILNMIYIFLICWNIFSYEDQNYNYVVYTTSVFIEIYYALIFAKVIQFSINLENYWIEHMSRKNKCYSFVGELCLIVTITSLGIQITGDEYNLFDNLTPN